MEGLIFRVTDSLGHYICDMEIPYSDLYFIKQYFVCDVQFCQLVLY